MIDYKALPPVEPIKTPSRFSMTLLSHDDDCPRSAYLYVKHKGGPGSHPMDRGTLAHAVLERALKTLVVRGERQFAPEEPEQAASIVHAFVDEVLRERPDLVVPRREVDAVREMAYHWAVGYDVDPEHVAGVERLMVLDLECGWTVSGKLDVIAFPSVELGQVDDYKSGQHIPAQEEYEGLLQPWVYAALLCFGVPVDVYPCPSCAGDPVWRCRSCGGMDAIPRACSPSPCTTCEQVTEQELIDCDRCEGKGRIEVRGEPFGQHLKGVLTRELYPHPRPRDDGTLHRREMLLSRTAIADFKADLERMAARLAGRFGSWDFPARAGSWCSECPAASECPLPASLRDHAGTINSVGEAEEAWALAQLQKARLAAIEREVKNFAKAHAVGIRVGDEVWRWEPKTGRAVRKKGRGSDWDGLQAAVKEAADFGTPFDVTEWVVATAGNEFKKSKVTDDERTMA